MIVQNVQDGKALKGGATNVYKPRNVTSFRSFMASQKSFMVRYNILYPAFDRLSSLYLNGPQTVYSLCSSTGGSCDRAVRYILSRLMAKGLVYRSPDNKYYLTELAIKELSSLL